MVGAILAPGRRAVTNWIRAAELSDEYRPCYTTVAAAGKRADSIASRLVRGVVKPLMCIHAGRARPDTPTEEQWLKMAELEEKAKARPDLMTQLR